jgi:hypothetical protein
VQTSLSLDMPQADMLITDAKAAIMRAKTTQESAQPKQPMQTPAEFSRMREERDQKYREKMEENRQRYLQAQRVSCPNTPMRWNRY